MSWRSPWMLPPPVDPGSVTMPEDPMARLLLGGAWRHRAFAQALAHGVRRAPCGEPALAVLERAASALRASDAFLASAADAGVADADRAVEARLGREPLPQPESWAEVAVADLLFGAALERFVGAAGSSSDARLAFTAECAALAPSFGAPVVEALAEDAPSRTCLDILLDRWAPASYMVFGRPGTTGDAALSASGARPPAAELLAGHDAWARSTFAAWGLKVPDAHRMGVILATP